MRSVLPVCYFYLSRACHDHSFPSFSSTPSSTPDQSPQNFERIRARWETAQPGDPHADSMVGRREKQAVQQPASDEMQENGPSKFRRKFSYGLAFISNPLSQRKITPGRQSMRVPSLAVTDTEADTGDAASTREADDECDTSFSSTVVTRPNVCSDDTPTKPTRLVNNTRTTNSATDDTTPRVVPRPRTFSYIPRPVSIQALATTSVDMNASINSVISLSTADPKSNASPSKIPTPSPPLSENRGSSPRQHLSAQTASQLKHVASTQFSEARPTGTITKTALRSRTTPKLVNVTNSQQPTGVTVPRKSALEKVAVPPVVEKPLLQENFSGSRRITQRRSHIQERTSGCESLAVIGNTPKRKSLGPAASAQSSQLDYTSPPADRNRSSMYSALRTPMTARTLQPRLNLNRPASDVVQVTGNGMFSQPRLMGPKNPPTPTPSIDFMQPGIQKSTVRNDLQRKTLGTPNGLAGVWRSSRALAATNHEVRKLPRSFTFHSFERKEAPPPLPSIPEQNRSESLAHITEYQYSQLELDTTKPRPEDNMPGGHSSATTTGGLNDEKYRFSAESTATRKNVSDAPATECSDTSSVFVARPPRPLPPPPVTPVGRRSLSLYDLESHSPGGSRRRPWPISFQSDPENADIDPILQVKDYMPPLYWAGRFQSRFDHWRTEALLGHLNPDHVRTGPMDGCHLDQEKLASCYIFGQLRDLCTTNQAADSLWEFEYRYRKDNKLLGNPLEFPAMSPYRKQDDRAPAHRGAFGRAVRKLTPRKSSLVNLRNLLKGKGKGEEERAGILFEGEVDTSSGDS